MSRRFALRLLIALAPTALVVGAVDRWLAATTTERAEAVFAAIADPALPLPDLVLGPSHASRSVDPTALDPTGARYWNLALDGASPGYLLRFYRHFRAGRPAPRRVLLVLPWFVFRPGCLERTWEHDAEHLAPAAFAAAALAAGPRLPVLIGQRFPFLKHRERLLDGRWAQAREGETFRATRGFAPYPTGPWRPWKPTPPYRGPDAPAEVEATAALLDALRADGVATTIVQLPTLRAATLPHAGADATLRALAAARGMRLLDYQADPRLPLADDQAAFRDWCHLNEAGSRRLGARLAADLAGG